MKQETYICIKGSPEIPSGLSAKWVSYEGGYMLYDGEVRLGISLAAWQVEQNPECWRRQVQKTTALCECVNVVVAMAGHCMDCGGSVPERPQDIARKEMIDEACRNYLNSPVHGVSYPEKLAEQKRQESIEREIAVIMDKYKTRPKDDEWYIASLHCALHELAQYFKIPN